MAVDGIGDSAERQLLLSQRFLDVSSCGVSTSTVLLCPVEAPSAPIPLKSVVHEGGISSTSVWYSFRLVAIYTITLANIVRTRECKANNS